MQTYLTHANIGTAKYVVSFHDGQKTHKDGSPFFDIRIFKSGRDRDKFLDELRAEGYVYAPSK